MSDALLEVHDLKVEFRLHRQGTLRAVDGVSFRVPRGATVALVGESGSGKSVIAQSIMGILPRPAHIAAGSILFRASAGRAPVDIAGLDPRGEAMRDIRGGQISMIFQEPMTSLSPLHTVGDQIAEAVRLHRRVGRREAREMAGDMLERVVFPQPRRALERYPFELSGGLRQRAMIAMALVCRPALLIADEPTTALDVTIQAQILELLQRLQEEFAMAVLLITHDLGVVANLAEHVAVIYHGRLMERGRVDDLYRDPRHPYLRGLMDAVPRVGMPAGERLRPLRDIERPEGSYLSRRREEWPAEARDRPLIEVRGVSKTFGARRGGVLGLGSARATLALDEVSLEIRRGECLGLVGESGCGKSTLSKVILRAIDPDRGEVIYNDRDGPVRLLDLDARRLFPFRRKMQFIFQDPVSSLNPRMTVFDIVCEPLVIHRLYDARERRAIVTELMQQVGLDARFLARYPHSFSGGQRQRIGIARALALNPELIVCDEPVSALDVSVQAQILNLLKDLQKDLGLTYLFISHNLAVVDYVAERIAVMCAGRLVEVAPRERLFRAPAHPYTRALLAAVPRTDPGERLDLAALLGGRVSDPAAWPAPFGPVEGRLPDMLELAPGHRVRAAVRPAEAASS